MNQEPQSSSVPERRAMFGKIADQPYEFTGRNGTQFSCERSDLKAPVRVSNRPGWEEDLVADTAQFAAMHALQVLPLLNGFTGYDAVHFIFAEED